jgi:hypothetical protein
MSTTTKLNPTAPIFTPPTRTPNSTKLSHTAAPFIPQTNYTCIYPIGPSDPFAHQMAQVEHLKGSASGAYYAILGQAEEPARKKKGRKGGNKKKKKKGKRSEEDGGDVRRAEVK